MQTFEFIRPADPASAIATAAHSRTAQQGADVRFLGGGTTLIDLMKLNVETPARVLDINRLPLDKIEATPAGFVKIGAMVRNSDLANDLADYMVTVNADAPPIEVHFLDHPDKEINEVGARGIGEIGLAGIAAAITDAVHHATGVRVRELPVKIEDLSV